MLPKMAGRPSAMLILITLLLAVAAACAPDIAKLQRQGKIEPILEALNYEKDASVRADAATALGELDAAAAVDPLIARLSDEIPAVRQAAALALCQIGDPAAITPSLLTLQAASPELQAACSTLLGSAMALDRLAAMSEDSDLAVRRAAALALSASPDPRVIDSLIPMLAQGDEAVRSAAHQALVDFGVPAIDPLVAALHRVGDEQRPLLAQILAEIGAPAQAALIELLGDPDQDLRQVASDLLLKQGQAVIEPLIRLLGSGNATQQDQAMNILSKIGLPAVQPLLASLADPALEPRASTLLFNLGEPVIDPLIAALQDPALAVPAGDLLARFGAPAIQALVQAVEQDPQSGAAAQELLLKALKSDKADLRTAAVDGLAMIGEPVLPALFDLVKQNHSLAVSGKVYPARQVLFAPLEVVTGKLADGGVCAKGGKWDGKIVLCARGEVTFIAKLRNVQKNGGVGVIFINSGAGVPLATLGEESEAEIPALTLSQEHGNELLKNSLNQAATLFNEEETKTGALDQVFQRIGEPAIPSLVSALSDDLLYDTAQAILVDLGEPAVTALIDTLQDPSPGQRINAIYILGETGDRRAFQPILASLKDSDAGVRLAAATTLGGYQNPAAIQPLVTSLQDIDQGVRSEAAKSLAEIGLPAVDSLLQAYRQTDDTGLRSDLAESLRDIFSQHAQAVISAAAKVCQGTSLTEAADFQRNPPGIHPLVILNHSQAMHAWTLRLPVDWLPFTPEQLQLVVCMEEQKKITVQVCQYRYRSSGMAAPSITRYRYETSGQAFAASSGKVLDDFKLKGDSPDACPWTTTTGTSSISGSQVGYPDFLKWLKNFIPSFGSD